MADDSEQDKFHIELKGPGLSFNREVTLDLAREVLNLIMGGSSAAGQERLAEATPGPSSAASGPPPATSSTGTSTAKQFLTSKKPETDVERVACLAYFLRHHRSVAAFKTRNLTQLNTEAQQRDFSNATATTNNAMRDGVFGKAGKGSKQITARGEAVVDALPDRERVKEAMKHGVKARRRMKNKKAKA